MTDYVLSAILALVCAFLIKMYYYQHDTIEKQLEDINKLISQKKSSEVRLG